MQQTAWWITGGLTKNGATTSTEVFNPTSSLPDKMSDGPELPFQIYGHCMLTLEMDTVRFLTNLNAQIGPIKTTKKSSCCNTLYRGSIRVGLMGSFEPMDFETLLKWNHKSNDKTYWKFDGTNINQIPDGISNATSALYTGGHIKGVAKKVDAEQKMSILVS